MPEKDTLLRDEAREREGHLDAATRGMGTQLPPNLPTSCPSYSLRLLHALICGHPLQHLTTPFMPWPLVTRKMLVIHPFHALAAPCLTGESS